jgi:hypothetical protein
MYKQFQDEQQAAGGSAAQRGLAMNKVERERRHQANLDRINRLQMVVGRADRMRVDHEGTLIERARMMAEEIASHQATETGLAALERLLRTAEEGISPYRREVLGFLNAVRDSRPLPLHTLRGLDARTGDDMVAVLDAYRYARMSLIEQLECGPARLARLAVRASSAAAGGTGR